MLLDGEGQPFHLLGILYRFYSLGNQALLLAFCFSAGRPSRLPRRRRHLARITLGAASRAAGGPGGAKGLEGAELEGDLSKGADSEQQAGGIDSPAPIQQHETASKAAVAVAIDSF